MRPCGLRHDDRLAVQASTATHAVVAAKATGCEQRFPLPPAQQRRVLLGWKWVFKETRRGFKRMVGTNSRLHLPYALSITALAEEPPAVGHAKGNLDECTRLKRLIYNQKPAWAQQLQAIAQRVAHPRCCVQHVGSDDEVTLR